MAAMTAAHITYRLRRASILREIREVRREQGTFHRLALRDLRRQLARLRRDLNAYERHQHVAPPFGPILNSISGRVAQ